MARPAPRRLGHAVLIEDVGPALYAVQLGCEVARARNGVVPAPFEQLRAVLASAYRGHGDVPNSRGPRKLELIRTSEAAEILGLSIRQARRLSDRIDTEHRAGRLMFDKAGVLAERARRQQRKESDT